MGKSKKRSRAASNRLNPLRNGKAKNGTDSNSKKDSATVNKKIQPLLQKLKSTVPNDRSMALSSITVLAEDPHMRSLLLKEKLVNTIITRLLSDPNTDIIVDSFGLLRNLVLEEGYDIATHLWRSEIWVSITDGFAKTHDALIAMKADESKSSKESKRLLFDYIDNLLSLVVALGNGSESILNEILNESKINKVFDTITDLLNYGYDKIPIALFNTILDLIYDFSSESYEFIDSISKNTVLSQFVKSLPELVKLVPGKHTFNELSVILTQGIYLQFLDMSINTDQIIEITRNTLTAVNDIDLKQVQEDLSVLDEDELVKADDATVATKIKNYTKKRNLALMRLQSVEIAIDLITAITEIIATLYEDKKTKLKLSDELMNILIDILPNAFHTLSDSFASRILIAWNNLLWLFITVGINIFELPNNQFEQLWNFVNGLEEQQKTDLALKMGRLSVIWAILKTITLTDEKSTQKILAELKLINNLEFTNNLIGEYKSASDEVALDEKIELKLRCCGVLGTFATIQGQVQVNDVIGKFLLSELSSKDASPVVLVELTNLLFQIYSDFAFDYDEPVFVQQGFLQILQDQVLSNLKSQFKFVDKNKDPVLKGKCTETLNNLNSFIQYKANEKS